MNDAIIGGRRIIPKGSAAYSPYQGYFGALSTDLGHVGPGLMWFNCRENFHSYDARNICEFYYVHPVNANIARHAAVDVANFMYLIETRLGLTYKSSFAYTDSPSVCFVKMASWWSDQPMRRQFFTLALRAALNWRRGAGLDLRTALLMNVYAGDTVYAVDRFLDGYTKYTGAVVGWHRQFTGFYTLNVPPTHEQVNALLVKPKHTDEGRYKEIERMSYFEWEKDGRPDNAGDKYWKIAEAKYRLDF